jgi:hypothetical protein
MDNYFVFGFIAALLPLVATFFYIKSILSGYTRINLAGNFIYIMATVMIITSSLALGVTSAILLGLGYLLCQVSVSVAGLKYGYFKFTKFDYLCITLSFFGLVLWLSLDAPMYGLVTNVFVDALGSLAILKKLYLHPETEASFPWFLALIAGVVNLLAIPVFNIENSLYTVYSIASSFMIFALSLRKLSASDKI